MLTNTAVKTSYLGDGGTVTFAIPFDIVADNDGSDEVEVILRDFTNPASVTYQILTLTTHYTLTGGTPPVNVTMVTAPTSNQNLIVRRKFPLVQNIDYLSSGPFPADTHELALDKLQAQMQLAFEYFSRVPQLNKGTQKPQPNMPEPQATTVWGWDADAQTVRNYTPAELASIAVDGLLKIAYNLSDLADVDEALDNLGIDPFKSTVSQSINNNEAVAQDITNLSFAGAFYTSAIVLFEIRRKTNSNSKIANGRLHVYRQPHTGTWAFDIVEWTGQDLIVPGGLTFSLNQVGNHAQIKYTSDNLTGANYEGTIKTSVKYFKV